MSDSDIVSIRSDDSLVGYVCTDPYEIGCVKRVQTRMESILSHTPAAVGLPHPTETSVPLPAPAAIRPTPSRTRAENFLLELDATTNLDLIDTKVVVGLLREQVDCEPLETDATTPTEFQLYTTLNETVRTVADEQSHSASLRELQRVFQSYLTQDSVSVARDRLQSEYESHQSGSTQ